MSPVRVVLLLAVTFAAFPAVAFALNIPPDDDGGGGGDGRKVRSLQPWRAKNLYRITHTFAARTEQSRLAPKTGNYVARGTWLPISCQYTVRGLKGRRVWNRIDNVGFVPDKYFKTYTDGRLERAARCRLPHPDHVWTRKPWARDNRYFVHEAVTPQKRPRVSAAGLPIPINSGTWVRIECQVRGGRYRRSRIWNRLRTGGYIPNATVRTFRRKNQLRRAPNCRPQKAGPQRFYALGDSYSSGLGADAVWRKHGPPQPDVVDYLGNYFGSNPPGRSDKDCWRSPYAYSRILARRMRTKRRHGPGTFLACQGDVVDDVLTKQLPYVKGNTTLVTLTIGGNDMGFSSIVRTCVIGSPGDCAGAIIERFGRNWEKLGDLGAKLDRLYWEISRKAPRAKVIVLGYPLLFNHPRRSARYCFMSQSAQAAKDLNAAGRMLNRTIRDAAGRHGFRFVGVARTFNGHGPCQDKGPRMWVNGIRVLGGHELHSMHPMKRGHKAEAMRVIRANPGLFS